MKNKNDLTYKYVWDAFLSFFREVKFYDNWTDEEIGGSMNNDDIDEFIEYIKECLEYEVK